MSLSVSQEKQISSISPSGNKKFDDLIRDTEQDIETYELFSKIRSKSASNVVSFQEGVELRKLKQRLNTLQTVRDVLSQSEKNPKIEALIAIADRYIYQLNQYFQKDHSEVPSNQGAIVRLINSAVSGHENTHKKIDDTAQKDKRDKDFEYFKFEHRYSIVCQNTQKFLSDGTNFLQKHRKDENVISEIDSRFSVIAKNEQELSLIQQNAHLLPEKYQKNLKILLELLEKFKVQLCELKAVYNPILELRSVRPSLKSLQGKNSSSCETIFTQISEIVQEYSDLYTMMENNEKDVDEFLHNNSFTDTKKKYKEHIERWVSHCKQIIKELDEKSKLIDSANQLDGTIKMQARWDLSDLMDRFTVLKQRLDSRLDAFKLDKAETDIVFDSLEQPVLSDEKKFRPDEIRKLFSLEPVVPKMSWSQKFKYSAGVALGLLGIGGGAGALNLLKAQTGGSNMPIRPNQEHVYQVTDQDKSQMPVFDGGGGGMTASIAGFVALGEEKKREGEETTADENRGMPVVEEGFIAQADIKAKSDDIAVPTKQESDQNLQVAGNQEKQQGADAKDQNVTLKKPQSIKDFELALVQTGNFDEKEAQQFAKRVQGLFTQPKADIVQSYQESILDASNGVNPVRGVAIEGRGVIKTVRELLFVRLRQEGVSRKDVNDFSRTPYGTRDILWSVNNPSENEKIYPKILEQLRYGDQFYVDLDGLINGFHHWAVKEKRMPEKQKPELIAESEAVFQIPSGRSDSRSSEEKLAQIIVEPQKPSPIGLKAIFAPIDDSKQAEQMIPFGGPSEEKEVDIESLVKVALPDSPVAFAGYNNNELRFKYCQVLADFWTKPHSARPESEKTAIIDWLKKAPKEIDELFAPYIDGSNFTITLNQYLALEEKMLRYSNIGALSQAEVPKLYLFQKEEDQVETIKEIRDEFWFVNDKIISPEDKKLLRDYFNDPSNTHKLSLYFPAHFTVTQNGDLLISETDLHRVTIEDFLPRIKQEQEAILKQANKAAEGIVPGTKGDIAEDSTVSDEVVQDTMGKVYVAPEKAEIGNAETLVISDAQYKIGHNWLYRRFNNQEATFKKAIDEQKPERLIIDVADAGNEMTHSYLMYWLKDSFLPTDYDKLVAFLRDKNNKIIFNKLLKPYVVNGELVIDKSELISKISAILLPIVDEMPHITKGVFIHEPSGAYCLNYFAWYISNDFVYVTPTEFYTSSPSLMKEDEINISIYHPDMLEFLNKWLSFNQSDNIRAEIDKYISNPLHKEQIIEMLKVRFDESTKTIRLDRSQFFLQLQQNMLVASSKQ